MKRVFEIKYPDKLGPLWMNEDNLLLCLNAYCKGTKFEICDLTDKVIKRDCRDICVAYGKRGK